MKGLLMTWTTRPSRSPADAPRRLLERAAGQVSPEDGLRGRGLPDARSTVNGDKAYRPKDRLFRPVTLHEVVKVS
jgi:hypothetical protein